MDGIFAVSLNDLELLMQKDIVFTIEGFENKAVIKKTVSRKDFHPLLFAVSMKVYMKVILQAAAQLSLDNTTNVKMPGVTVERNYNAI